MSVASAGITSVSHFSASSLILPILSATGALVRMILAPSSCAFSAVFHASDFSSSAPKIIPFFPFNKLWVIA